MEQILTIEELLANAANADQSKAGSLTKSSSSVKNTEETTATVETATTSDTPYDKWTIDAPNETDIQSDQASRAQGRDDVDISTSTIEIAFVDFSFQPIEGMKYKFIAGDKITTGVTDVAGKAESLVDIAPNAEVEILVFREHTKDYKQVGVLLAHSGWVGYTVVSPKIKFETETEEHVGASGKAEKNLPPVPSKTDSTSAQTPNAVIAAQPSAIATKSDTTATSSKNASSSMPSSGHAKSPSAPANPSASAGQKKSDIVPGRDARGNPQATVQDAAVDWLKRKILAVYNFWSWKDFQKPEPTPPTGPKQPTSSPPATDKKATGAIKQPKQSAKRGTAPTLQEPPQGHPKVNAPTAPALGRKLNEAELERLNRLVEFAEHQITLNYSEYKGQAPTTKVLAEYVKLASPSFPSKPVNQPLGMCQVYVKIALFKTGYTNGSGNEPQAKTAGKDWLAYGFVEISNQLPQIEITYETAMAAKDMPKANEILSQRVALAALKKRRIKEKKPMSADEILSAEREIPALPEITTAKYTQPDLMYTCPGDVIVYEQVDPVEYDPAGHVDIRTYHGFLSDFVWGMIPSLGGMPRKKRYRVIGVYRKCSDTLAILRVSAFLRIIRELEAKGYKEPYRALARVQGKETYFDDYSTHPGSLTKPNLVAGTYQIKWNTWSNVIKNTGWPASFGPAMQDRLALYLLQERPFSKSGDDPIRRTALGYLMEGKLEQAVEQAVLHNLWSCLPGGGKEQQITMPELKTRFNQYLSELIK